MPIGICTAKRRLWVEGDVQLYIRFEKASPSRNGVRLHLTFLRLATLVGIGHEGPGEGANDSTPPIKNEHKTFSGRRIPTGIKCR